MSGGSSQYPCDEVIQPWCASTCLQYLPCYFLSSPDPALCDVTEAGTCGVTCQNCDIDPASLPSSMRAWLQGDPHATNMAGEKFNILALGEFEFIRFPRHATEEQLLLSIRGTIKRLGTHCRKDWMKNPDSFIRDLTLSGAWLKEQNGKVEIRAEDGEVGQALQIRGATKDGWHGAQAAEGAGFGALFKEKNATEIRMGVGPAGAPKVVALRVSMKTGKGAGEEGPIESHYLNLGIQGLEKLQKLGEVGGILGLDDHGDTLVPPSDCPNAVHNLGRRDGLRNHLSEEDWPSDQMFVGGR